MSREAMQMALEALEDANDVARMEFSDEDYYSEAINALRQALEIEPKALRLADALDAEFVQGRISNSTGRESAVELRRLHEVNQDLLKALHKALETEQEPVAFINVEKQKLEWAKLTSWYTPTIVNLPKIPLYTAPPKREWVGLTADEVYECWMSGDVVAAVEAKLREKNKW